MLRPVERSITVSAPQRIAHTILSTSSSTDDVTAELPILALILVRKLRPMIIGSSSAWLMLEGMMARPRAISLLTNSGVMKAGTAAPKLSPSASMISRSGTRRSGAASGFAKILREEGSGPVVTFGGVKSDEVKGLFMDLLQKIKEIRAWRSLGATLGLVTPSLRRHDPDQVQ